MIQTIQNAMVIGKGAETDLVIVHHSMAAFVPGVIAHAPAPPVIVPQVDPLAFLLGYRGIAVVILVFSVIIDHNNGGSVRLGRTLKDVLTFTQISSSVDAIAVDAFDG